MAVFALSGKDDVMSVIRETIRELEGKVKVVDWEEMDTAGNINQQVITEISTADFGARARRQPLVGVAW